MVVVVVFQHLAGGPFLDLLDIVRDRAALLLFPARRLSEHRFLELRGSFHGDFDLEGCVDAFRVDED